MCVFTFAALAVCAYAPEEAERAILYVGVALAAKAAYLVLYGALSLFPKKKSGPKPAAKPRVAEYVDMSEQFPPAVGAQRGSELKKVRCFTEPEYAGDEYDSYASDVRLDHIFSVVERLKGVSLGAGDRLEVQKYEDLLTVYKSKNALSSEEAPNAQRHFGVAFENDGEIRFIKKSGAQEDLAHRFFQSALRTVTVSSKSLL